MMGARRGVIVLCLLLFVSAAWAQKAGARERVSLDADWSFALGDARGMDRDYNFATQPFFFGKAGYGDGPAANAFDDRGWRRVSLPHDWAVSLPLDAKATTNHGSRAIGLLFPQNSVGWYRRRLAISAADEGRRVVVHFDGIYRDASVWINGFYLGEEHSGYSPQSYDLTDYLNYGGENILVVRVDATREEGWFYEGGGIYRHAWLEKTAPAHLVDDSLFVTSRPEGSGASASVAMSVRNDAATPANYAVILRLLDADGRVVAETPGGAGRIDARSSLTLKPVALAWTQARLWSPESPNLYRVVAELAIDGAAADRVESSFGVREARFDADKGFFLNGRHVELRGVNLHQDYAGVGLAAPDALIEDRLERLQSIGVNAIRTSHHPASRAFLELCDRLGLMVVEETRQAGVTPEVLDQLRRMIERDRNHPSIILWSMGNEEWKLEWSPQGERVARDMQAYAHSLDPSRMTTFAMSGSGGRGVNAAAEVLGFNYFKQNDFEAMHKRYPTRPMLATEESSSMHTRGAYADDASRLQVSDYDVTDSRNHAAIEESLRFHREHPYSAGLFFWTGFDYRGETTPYDWPAVGSQFGVFDQCGFEKTAAWILRAAWTRQPMVHVAPHWTWPGREGQPVKVVVYGNVSEVELFLNGRSLGVKMMPENSHLEWEVKYEPGELRAVGYRMGREVRTEDVVRTAGAVASLELSARRSTIAADGSSVAVVAVSARDAKGVASPVADNLARFTIRGPGRILGVGNGDPASHEAEQLVENHFVAALEGWRTRASEAAPAASELAADFDDSQWRQPDDPRWDETRVDPLHSLFRGAFTVEKLDGRSAYKLLLRAMGERQSFWLNGHLLAQNLARAGEGWTLEIDPKLLRVGKNVLAIAVDRFSDEGRKTQNYRWDNLGPAKFAIYTPAAPYQRHLFNGLAAVIVQSTGEPGVITLTAEGDGVKSSELQIEAK